MTRKRVPYVSMKRFGLPDISMPAIRKYARQIAERFKPDKIILFGSFAYGEPNEDSDVDLLVVMACPNHVTQAGAATRGTLSTVRDGFDRANARKAASAGIKEALIGSCARSPSRGSSFMTKETGRWVRKAEADFRMAKSLARDKPAQHDGVCFHCQQSAEKYLKAFLPRSDCVRDARVTHDLERLSHVRFLTMPTFVGNLRQGGLAFLTIFAVDFRYPEKGRDNARQSKAAVRWAERVRARNSPTFEPCPH